MPIIQPGGSNAPIVSSLTASGSWSPAQSGLKYIRVKGCGGGGGGGGGASAANSRAAGGGGGGGGYFEHIYTAAQLTPPVAYVIGAGGTAGPVGGVNPGGDGSSTTWMGLTAGGGSGGTGMTPYTGTIIQTSPGGGSGNVGGSPMIGQAGGAGTWGACSSTYVLAAGQGGATPLAQAVGIRTSAPNDGVNGRLGGGGGGGGAGGPTGAGLGGVGGPGLIIVEEYY